MPPDTLVPTPILPLLESDLGRVVLLGCVRAEPVAAGVSSPALLVEIERVVSALVSENAGRVPSEIPGLAAARELCRAFGIDPTHTRPSSEALLRRALQGKPFPRILNAVDVCNLCAVRFLLPIGLYDAAAIRGRVVLRRGRPGESFHGIRKDAVHLDGRPALADDDGPFGNPTSDSQRTSVTESTRSLFMVIFAPASYPRPALEAHVALAREIMGAHLAPPGGAVATDGRVIP